ncbi:MAG: cytochrome c biogenesis protein CcdA [Candidatus Omnitrophota bacterium]
MIQQLSLYLQDQNLIAYPVVFLAGVLTSLTPCIYPLIPILVGYIGGKQEKSRFANFTISLSYVLGMAVTFAALGAAAALTGSLFGQLQTSPWSHLIVGNIIILFGLSLLGVIHVPQIRFFAKGSAAVHKKKGLLGAFLMGLFSGLVAAPCTTAVLGALLTFVASKQNVIFGTTLLFTFALGMGTLLLILGIFAGVLTSMPKSGKWTVLLQKAFGFFMIGVGEFFVIKAGMLLV